ncbi:MAG: sodium-dependent transporter [Leptospiraceae bacterium]|nr:sodium-dependent transporter [Leptospiraceae bacterium]MCP5511992.1 sodium-dependent transporter [Leptospiraceae bacterium]
MSNPNPKERWGSKIGLILVVASSAIGLGNFLRFPGQAAKNGGGAFMVPYLISFLVLGIPVCLSEWIMGRMGGKNGHSSINVFRTLLGNTFLANVSASIAILIPTVIYIYYVFIEAWCISYAMDFLTGNISFQNPGLSNTSPEYIQEVVKNSSEYFVTLTGATSTGAALVTKIIPYTLFCFAINFFVVYRGLSKGLEALAKISVPILLIFASIILVRVLTLPGIEQGLGYMWNPDWEALKKGEVWVAAAGQIFFSLSVGFGIVLIFTSYLTEKDDVTLSSLTAASLNEMVEVSFGGLITIPVGFLFLGLSVASFGTFGMGFIALPSVFSLMPAGQVFGTVWFFVLFIAAVTSSVTMLQPGINFLEEGFHLKRRTSITILFLITSFFTGGIIYFNKDFIALDTTDFWVGTMLIYILATIQVIIYGWKIGPERARKEAEIGSHLKLPKAFDFVIKYITPTFLIIVLIVFLNQSLMEYVHKMDPEYMVQNAASFQLTEEEAREKAQVSRAVFFIILSLFGFVYYLVRKIEFKIKVRKEEHGIE